MPAWFNLGQIGLAGNDLAAAEAAFRRVLELAPDMTDARLGLARALMRRPEPERANAEVVALLEGAWERMNPAAEARYLLADALRGCGRFAEAAAHVEALVAERPGRVELHNLLGNCYNKLGRMREAIAEYRQVLKLAPDFAAAHSAILGCLNYVPEITPQQVFQAHRDWAAAVARPLYPLAPTFANVRDPDRRLRIGTTRSGSRPSATTRCPAATRSPTG
jgi:cytochrome c-type biogenesis protein CcmH/NrfG